MTEGRWYSLLIVILIVVVVALLLLFNWLQQPEGLDRALLTIILGFIASPLAVLLNNMNANKQAKNLQEGQEQIKQAVANQGHEMTNKAADIAYTASELARDKKG